jgi:hypothetical protein
MADTIAYVDFDILLEQGPQGYRARVIGSPAGSAANDFAAPFSNLELENFVLRLGQQRSGLRRLDSPQMAAARVIGTQLFDAAMGGEVGTCFARSLDGAQQTGRGLRIRLRLAEVPELADWPWEYVYSKQLGRFLALSIQTPIVRYQDLVEVIRPLSVKPPLHILAVIASPSNMPSLNVEAEWTRLRNALADLEQRGLVHIDRLNTATLAELQARLRRSEYHIVHFIGHGAFDGDAQAGVIVLEDETGQAHPVSGQEFGMLLHDERTLRLIVLNACEGARSSRADPFGGVAQSLVRQGVPAVIAMQFAISDTAAIAFTREFYAALADGYPVDAALAEARKAIFALPNDVEWGTPVLYMRAPDGRIFDVAPGSTAPQPASGPNEAASQPPAQRPTAPEPQPTGVPESPTALPKKPGCTLSVAISFAAMIVLVTGISMAGFGPLALNRATPTPIGGVSMDVTLTPPFVTTTPTSTPSPTASPTSAPSPTATPTATPRPQARCVSASSSLSAALRAATDTGVDVGCPIGAAVSVEGALQEFISDAGASGATNRPRNLMIWRGDTREIYALIRLIERQESRLEVRSYRDTWEEGQPQVPPACTSLSIPSGFRFPVRGFAKTWCGDRLAANLGWPIEDERAATLLIQPTQSGLLLRAVYDNRTYFAALNLEQGTGAIISQ